jgi:hypothetical protein
MDTEMNDEAPLTAEVLAKWGFEDQVQRETSFGRVKFHVYPETSNTPGLWLWLNGELLPKNMTVGQFKRLCIALEIPMSATPEKENQV